MSIVRLAYNPGPINAYKALAEPEKPPHVRLALCNSPAERNGTTFVDPLSKPALLVSYVYLKPFLKNRPGYYYRDWVMDSGAFSAHNSGTKIDLQAYIDCCKEHFASDPTSYPGGSGCP